MPLAHYGERVVNKLSHFACGQKPKAATNRPQGYEDKRFGQTRRAAVGSCIGGRSNSGTVAWTFPSD